MTKFYNEPEFKVVMMASQDVMTASLDIDTSPFNTANSGDSGVINPDDLGFNV